jgi:nitronate monooxygenase
MFLVSGADMVLAACKAGIIGSFPANNARTLDDLDAWMGQIAATLPADAPPWAVNIMVHRSYARWEEELELVLKHRPPIVITALGSPTAVVEAIQDYGGLVYADVNSLTYARKAAATGVDGLILVAAGAGGHTGQIAGFAFAPAVREWFGGTIVLGGGIGTGRAVRAAQLLGADLAYLGTRLIACEESLAAPGYKQMLVEASAEDIVTSASLTGIPANWLKPSLLAAGYDAEGLKTKAEINLGRPEDAAARWRDVWSAGQGAGEVRAIEPLSEIIDAMAADYTRAARP